MRAEYYLADIGVLLNALCHLKALIHPYKIATRIIITLG